MEVRQLALDAEKAATSEGKKVLTLEGKGAKQPLLGIRGELMCVNSAGNGVYRYTKKQCRKIAEKAFAVIGREVVLGGKGIYLPHEAVEGESDESDE